ncbi:hypothetical protein RJ639_023956 [Escallonia herrerae]|uniref:Uncharacterized protein n=1 Tax=Escallonia herrerae TaxID=1293975 RepID=A0AA88UYT6_9ASTE|nr:hypothetical protein RJ639_023956 [Escallonia herrerae]
MTPICWELVGEVSVVNENLPEEPAERAEKHAFDPRVHRLLDERFDSLKLQEYSTESTGECHGATDKQTEYPFGENFTYSINYQETDELELDETYIVPSDLLCDVKDSKSLETAADTIHRSWNMLKSMKMTIVMEVWLFCRNLVMKQKPGIVKSIVSTYSNMDKNHGKIEAPEVRKHMAETISGALNGSSHKIFLKGKQMMPVDFLPHGKIFATKKVEDASRLRAEQQKEEATWPRVRGGKERGEAFNKLDYVRHLMSTCFEAAVEEERREARDLKKEMQGLYRCEGQHAQKLSAFTGSSSIHLM